MNEYTNFTKVFAEEVKATKFVGPVTGNADSATLAAEASKLSGSVISANSLSKAVDYALSATEKAKLFTGLVMTATSKVLTLGLAAGQAMIVMNTGDTNAYTVKNVADDTGTSLAAGKAVLIIGSATADASLVIALN